MLRNRAVLEEGDIYTALQLDYQLEGTGGDPSGSRLFVPQVLCAGMPGRLYDSGKSLQASAQAGSDGAHSEGNTPGAGKSLRIPAVYSRGGDNGLSG